MRQQNASLIWRKALAWGFVSLTDDELEAIGIETPMRFASRIAQKARQAEFEVLEEARRHRDAVLDEARQPFRWW